MIGHNGPQTAKEEEAHLFRLFLRIRGRERNALRDVMIQSRLPIVGRGFSRDAKCLIYDLRIQCCA